MEVSRSRTSQRRPQPAPRATSYSVNAVQTAYIPYYWDFVKGYIQNALEHAHGEIELSDVYNYLMAERMYLYIIRRPLICGAATVEICQYTRKKSLRVVTMSGEDFDEWRSVLNEALLDYCARIHADGIEAYVRKGLVPKMKAEGYKQIYVGMWLDGKKLRD